MSAATTSLEELVAGINPGDQVVLGAGTGLPRAFAEALARADGLDGVTVHHTFALGPLAHLDGEAHVSTWFAQAGAVADAVAAGGVSFVPTHFSRLSTTVPRVDHLVVQVAPARDGAYPYGVFCGYNEAVRARAGRVIAEVNPHAPAVGGASLKDPDVVYEAAYELPELPVDTGGGDPVTEALANHVAALIPDGATLQLGYGKITDAIVARLRDRRHLGLHTETFTDAVIDLVEAGALDNARKRTRPGASTCTLMMGTRRLYEYVDGRDDVELAPVEWVNDPHVIASNPAVMAINSALEIDLWGQANTEHLNGRQIGGIGGQVDFARGAVASAGGRFILAATSTAKRGAVSRIVPHVLGPVSTSRADVDTVVTEHGVAELRGRSVRERAHALIGIADPAFRDELAHAAEEMGLA